MTALATARREPVAADAYFLLAGTVAGGLLGSAYWIAAARLLTPRQLGIDAALLTLMTLVASVSGLNLPGALAFLVPRLGRGAHRPVRRAYALTTGLTVTLAVVGMGVARRIGAAPHVTSTVGAIGFCVAAAGLALFTLQDGVLLGLGRARWVLPESVVFGAAKLALLPLLAWWGVTHVVLLSWVLPAVLLVVLISGVLVPQQLRAAGHGSGHDGGLRGFVGLTAAGSLLYQAYLALLPLLVLGIKGPAAGAAFYVAWTWSSALDLGAHALGGSLTVQVSHRPGEAGLLLRHLASRTALLVGTGVIGLLAVAPVLLHLYGDSYLAATPALRLLVLGSLPRAVVILVQSAARGTGQAGVGLWTEALLCSTTLVVAVLLVPAHGGTGAAVAWLVANAVGAVAVVPAWRRLVRVGQGS